MIQAYAAIGIGLIPNVVSWKFGDNSGPTSGFKATHRKQRGAYLIHRKYEDDDTVTIRCLLRVRRSPFHFY